MIITIANEKGGCGKSTLAINTACYLAQNPNVKIIAVDADPQCSLTMFFDHRAAKHPELTKNLSHVQCYGNIIKDRLLSFKQKFDYVIVDIGGAFSNTLVEAVKVSNMLLTPILPSQLDVWGFEKVINTLDASGLSVDLNLIVNKADHGKVKLTNDVYAYLSTLSSVKLLNSKLGYRINFKRSIENGLAVFEYESQDNKAIDEFKQLMEELGL